MSKIEQLSKQAQRYANGQQIPMAVFNLNRIGAPMYVIRPADSFPNENRMITGPFQPECEPALDDFNYVGSRHHY
jgi:hypothetical protein